MIPVVVISLITFLLVIVSILFFPHLKIKKITLDTYWMIALLGALILIIFGLVPIKDIGSELTSSKAINPLKILILFFSMTIISIFLDEFGLFKYLADKAAQKIKGSQMRLFLMLYALTSVLTIFTSNDIVILTLTPFICFFCKHAKINPLPYLIGEFVAANTWSLMFIIGNPTNIYLATSAGINFVDYFKVMWLPTLLAGITEIVIMLGLFYKKLQVPITVGTEDEHIESRVDVIIGLTHLLVCLAFLIISSYINVEMWLVSLISGTSLVLCTLVVRLMTKEHWNYLGESFKRLPYQLIPFFLSMFVIVVAYNYQGITGEILKFLGNSQTVWVYGYSSFLTCNLINNIPMSMLFSDVALGLTGTNYSQAIFASIIGSNIGAFLTPIGALTGIMFTGLVNKHGMRFRFIDFVMYGAIIAIPTITVALAGLLI